MMGKEKLDGPHRLLHRKVILLAGPTWGRKQHRPRIFMFIGKLPLWSISPPPLTFFHKRLYFGIVVQLSIYVYLFFFSPRTHIGETVSVLVLLYIIANFKMNCTQTEIYKKNTQHNEKERRVESVLLLHRETQPVSCALQRVNFAPVHQVSAWNNLLKQSHNRNTDTTLITI